jgi:hypothetical protein
MPTRRAPGLVLDLLATAAAMAAGAGLVTAGMVLAPPQDAQLLSRGARVYCRGLRRLPRREARGRGRPGAAPGTAPARRDRVRLEALRRRARRDRGAGHGGGRLRARHAGVRGAARPGGGPRRAGLREEPMAGRPPRPPGQAQTQTRGGPGRRLAAWPEPGLPRRVPAPAARGRRPLNGPTGLRPAGTSPRLPQPPASPVAGTPITCDGATWARCDGKARQRDGTSVRRQPRRAARPAFGLGAPRPPSPTWTGHRAGELQVRCAR